MSMKIQDSKAFFSSINRGLNELKRQRNNYDNKNKREQFFAGVGAAVEKYSIFADGPYGNTSAARKEAQDLVKDYGGYFEEGVRFGILICEYDPKETDFEFRKKDEQRVVNTDNFTFTG
ncbi:hypothetical protein M199_gp208 [Halogranum tailed virus 1]|uniref:Uncharacterized protein n=1 Tax=Halogranum tailed virus 1 TaxID=1273749 RepID=R4TMQ5_9CAUD|nr:hypothetical protein M199_gp208 [Halogranum tailed virus 1]AGM11458.1 hypothetical protein HGTV1_161 [Halogranum tailed virus 1]